MLLAVTSPWIDGAIAVVTVLAIFVLLIGGTFWFVDPNKKKRK